MSNTITKTTQNGAHMHVKYGEDYYRLMPGGVWLINQTQESITLNCLTGPFEGASFL